MVDDRREDAAEEVYHRVNEDGIEDIPFFHKFTLFEKYYTVLPSNYFLLSFEYFNNGNKIRKDETIC